MELAAKELKRGKIKYPSAAHTVNNTPFMEGLYTGGWKIDVVF